MKNVLLIGLCLLVETIFAQPYVPNAIWDRSGETDNSWYGKQILALGDQNNDGFADWAVNTGFGQSLEFYHGASTLPLVPYHVFHLDTAAYLGFGAQVIGDVNGDGYEDWILTQTRRPNGVIADHGVFLGGPAARDTPDVVFTTSFQVTAKPIGDFNGDENSDIYTYDFQTDVLRIYFGGNPMDTLPDWILCEPPEGLIQSVPYAAGDFTGDGASDFMCFDMNNGNLAVFLGGANPDTVPAYFWSNSFYPYSGIDSLNGDDAAEWGGSYVHFGRPVLSPIPDVILNSNFASYAVDAGDFNGDGYHDLILYTWDTGTNPFGALDLHLGHPWLNPDPVLYIEGDTPPLNLRGIYTAVGLGDVNGDGLGDFAIGVWNETFGPRRGRCVIISGDSSLISHANDNCPELPDQLDVSIFPNPFNSETTVHLLAPLAVQKASLSIVNVLGQEVMRNTLRLFRGEYVYRFDARNLPTGLYFLNVESGPYRMTQKLVLMR